MAGCGAFRQVQQHRTAVYDDLKQLCDSIPVPTGLEKSGSQDIIKPEGGVFTNNFETELSCEDASKPFYEYLVQQGWQPTKQHLGYYYKENYLFSVTCRQPSVLTGKRTVQASCSWDQSGKDKDMN